MKRIMLLTVIAAMLCPAAITRQASAPSPDEVYAAFNKLCQESFGAEKEPLTYQAFGRENKLREGSFWLHASLNSACVAWQTRLPSLAFVEFGPDAKYGSKTEPHERFFYTHVHYLKGLAPGKTYHYRLVATDERGNRLTTPDATFTTLSEEAVTTLGGGKLAQPLVISKPGHYVLTADLTSDTTGIEIKSGEVTLDLNGMTVVYDEKKMGPIDGSFPKWFSESASGVRVAGYGYKKVRILNGAIRQGAGRDGAQGNAMGFSPLALTSGDEASEVAGISMEYSGPQITGLQKRAARPEIHHNVITDKGTEIMNRHQGCAALSGSEKVHHNLVKRARHRGIDTVNSGDIYANEVYVDSCATNAFDISLYGKSDMLVRDNLLFGSGYLVVAVATVSNNKNNRVVGNFMHVQATAPSGAWTEYGEQSGAYCTRVTWGGENILYERNYMITKGRDKGMVRGVWIYPQDSASGVVFRNNVIKAIAENEATTKRGAVVVTGDWQSKVWPPTLFENNTIISNFINVLIGEDYGIGCNAVFKGCTFVREGPAYSDYRTIQIGFWDKDTHGHTFIDSTFEGGAGYDKVKFAGNGIRREFQVGWTLTVKTAPGANVRIADKDGKEVAAGTADADGQMSAAVIEYVHTPDGKQPQGPYKVTVAKDGKAASADVNVVRKMQVEVRL